MSHRRKPIWSSFHTFPKRNKIKFLIWQYSVKGNSSVFLSVSRSSHFYPQQNEFCRSFLKLKNSSNHRNYVFFQEWSLSLKWKQMAIHSPLNTIKIKPYKNHCCFMILLKYNLLSVMGYEGNKNQSSGTF